MGRYNHEWEIFAARNPKLINTQLLKMCIVGLKHNICNELKLWKPQNVDGARNMSEVQQCGSKDKSLSNKE